MEVVPGIMQAHPEIAFFLVLGLGYLLGKVVAGQLQARGRHRNTAGGRAGWPARRDAVERRQAVLLPAVPVCDRFPDRPAVFPGSQERRPAARGARGHRRDHRSVGCAGRRPMLFGYDAGTAAGLVAGSLDRVGHDRHGDGCDFQAGPVCRGKGRAGNTYPWLSPSRTSSASSARRGCCPSWRRN